MAQSVTSEVVTGMLLNLISDESERRNGTSAVCGEFEFIA
jgi:hypothetical protein